MDVGAPLLEAREVLADLAFYKAAYEELKGERDKPAPRELPPASSS